MKDHSHDTARGQSLVEFALAIPILLLNGGDF